MSESRTLGQLQKHQSVKRSHTSTAIPTPTPQNTCTAAFDAFLGVQTRVGFQVMDGMVHLPGPLLSL
jgi:hypothetical protein